MESGISWGSQMEKIGSFRLLRDHIANFPQDYGLKN